MKKASRLGEIGEVRMCKRILKKQTSLDYEIPFYKISTFGDKADTFIQREVYEEFKNKYNYPKKGDVLISAAGTIGKTVEFDGEESYFQDSNIVWIENDEAKVLNKYLYYYYKTEPWRTTGGSIIRRLYNSDLRSLNITYPSEIEKQKDIISILSALDTKIELNNQINQQLEEMAKTTYDYWFVQFDFPDEEGKPYKSSGGKMVYNKQLRREIPVGWEVKRLEEIEKNIITGKTPSTKREEYYDGEIPFVTINDIRQDLFIHSTERTLTQAGADTQKNKYLYKGDIAVSCIGTIGMIGIIGRTSQTNQQINTISQVDYKNKYYLLNSLRDYFHFNEMAAKKGAVLSNMNKGEFCSILLIDPSDAVKQSYAGIAGSVYGKIENNILQNQELASLRDWLLPMLMNGQVTVGEY